MKVFKFPRRCFVAQSLLKKVEKANLANDKKVIKVYSRSSTILHEMKGLTFDVHNGKTFHSFVVSDMMIGHKMGEFSPTRKFVSHSGKKKK